MKNLNQYKLIIFDLDGTLVRYRCNWEKIKEYRAQNKNEEADDLELKGAIDSDPIDEVINLLIQSKCKKALFSMNSKESVIEALQKFHLYKLFDIIITKEDVRNGKPNPEGLQLINDKFNFSKDEILYIGDRSIDMLTGEKFGVDTAYAPCIITKLDYPI